MTNSQRTLVATLLGAPNAGKSTLLNQLTGTKVAIVSPKVQTTRQRICGIVMEDDAQLVLTDTPGVFDPKGRFESALVDAARGSIAGTDAVLLLSDAKHDVPDANDPLLRMLEGSKTPIWLVLNKIDLVKKNVLLERAAAWQETGLVSQIFMVSALNGDGVEDLRAALADAAVPGPWLYPPDQLSDMPEKLFAAEITREKLFLRLRQELPYSVMVESEKWEQRGDGSIAINQAIYVERESHKKIVLGKGGSMLKQIGASARHELENLLDCRVHLFLFVKVVPNWKDRAETYQLLGSS